MNKKSRRISNMNANYTTKVINFFHIQLSVIRYIFAFTTKSRIYGGKSITIASSCQTQSLKNFLLKSRIHSNYVVWFVLKLPKKSPCQLIKGRNVIIELIFKLSHFTPIGIKWDTSHFVEKNDSSAHKFSHVFKG